MCRSRCGLISFTTRCYQRWIWASPRREFAVVAGAAWVRRVANRHEAVEDLAWALLNSAEFRYRK
jgi:hypothetical protein